MGNLLAAIVLLLLTILACQFIVVGNASGRTYDNVDSIPYNRYGLLLATSPAIRDSLVARGIPADRIILDYEWLRTINSIVKAKEIYGLDSVTLISQKYHNERAIYLADHYNLHAIGYNAAPSHIRRIRIKNTIREFFARVKMFVDFTYR